MSAEALTSQLHLARAAVWLRGCLEACCSGPARHRTARGSSLMVSKMQQWGFSKGYHLPIMGLLVVSKCFKHFWFKATRYRVREGARYATFEPRHVRPSAVWPWQLGKHFWYSILFGPLILGWSKWLLDLWDGLENLGLQAEILGFNEWIGIWHTGDVQNGALVMGTPMGFWWTTKCGELMGWLRDSLFQWPFQDPKLQVPTGPTVYRAYIRPIDYCLLKTECWC